MNHSTTGIMVRCKDGSQYADDVVAGADGIHSVVRSETWRHGDSLGPLNSLANDRTGEYTVHELWNAESRS